MTGNGAAVSISTAMKRIDRRGFLRPNNQSDAGLDHPLPIGHNQTNSQPTTVANMLELLSVPPRAAVLDIGSGSGWTTALLAYLVGSEGTVLGLERHPELAEWGAENLAQHNMGWARIELATPGELGRPQSAGYDRILVSAAATTLPDALIQQMAPGARMVIPVNQTLLLIERAPYLDEGPQGALSSLETWGYARVDDSPISDELRVTEHGGYRFVPLID